MGLLEASGAIQGKDSMGVLSVAPVPDFPCLTPVIFHTLVLTPPLEDPSLVG